MKSELQFVELDSGILWQRRSTPTSHLLDCFQESLTHSVLTFVNFTLCSQWGQRTAYRTYGWRRVSVGSYMTGESTVDWFVTCTWHCTDQSGAAEYRHNSFTGTATTSSGVYSTLSSRDSRGNLSSRSCTRKLPVWYGHYELLAKNCARIRTEMVVTRSGPYRPMSCQYFSFQNCPNTALFSPFTPDLKLTSFTNPFLRSLLISCRLLSRTLNL